MGKLSKEWSAGKDLGLFILRVVLAIGIIYGHGWGKLGKVINGEEIQFLDPIGIGETFSFYLALFAEFVCALFVLVGYYSRIALGILTINMAVIVFFVKLGQPFGSMEVAFLYLGGFFAAFLLGPGKFSIDGLLKK